MSVDMMASGYIRNQLDAVVYNSNDHETLRQTTFAEADVEPAKELSSFSLNDRKKLPNEVLMEIFCHMDPSTLYKAGRVCKRWSEVVQVMHDKAWRKMTKAVKINAKVIRPKYKSRGWIVKKHSWNICKCIKIDRDLVLYEDYAQINEDFKLLNDSTLSREIFSGYVKVDNAEKAEAASRLAAAGLIDEIDRIESTDLVFKKVWNFNDKTIKHTNIFRYIHCKVLDLRDIRLEDLSNADIIGLTKVMNDGVRELGIWIDGEATFFPFIENYDGRGRCKMIMLSLLSSDSNFVEFDLEKIEDWVTSRGWHATKIFGHTLILSKWEARKQDLIFKLDERYESIYINQH